MSEQLALLPGYLTAHLQLTLVALLLGAGLSVPLGVFVTRRRALEGPVLGVAAVIQTIPSLALLAIMVPTLAALAGTAEEFGIELRSIGYLPAIIALSLYSMLPILRNTVAGILGVDPALHEAARGVGMTPGQRLRRVELPLAMPVIVAGLRTATVWVVGTATLSTPVGATSLGNFIFTGLQTRNNAAILVGCLAAAGLAIVLDQVIRGLEVGLRDRRRALVAVSTIVLGGLVAVAAGAWWQDRSDDTRSVVIGSKSFTEQYILAEVLGQWVEARTDQRAEGLQSLGTTVLFDALVTGDVDIYVDYSGTVWAEFMGREDLPGRAAVLAGVTEWLEGEQGLHVVGNLGFQNTYALGMRRARAEELGVRTISDLARVAPRLEIGGDYVFFDRAEWDAIESEYGLHFRAERTMDPALMYEAVGAGQVDVISAYSTDGRIASMDLVLLEDDRAVIPPYDAIVLTSARLAREAPDVLTALGSLANTIDEARMQQMNFEVDDAGKTPAEVARNFLTNLE